MPISQMKTLIKNGLVLDPAVNFKEVCDVLIIGNRIEAIDKNLACDDCTVIDAKGKLVVPGLIDLHVHLRDPGQTEKEDIASGTKAAAQGGFTSIACMPNTIPVLDSPGLIKDLMLKIKEKAWVNVFPLGSITLESEGRALTDFRALKEAGVVGLSDDGRVVQNAELMYRALTKAKDFGLPISQHAEDTYLSAGTVINDGEVAFRLGVKGDPQVSEGIIVARDIMLASHTGGHIHFGHISCRESVELIGQAKERGINVTAEVTPHHLILTEEDVLQVGVNGKMRPPLRTKEDVNALRKALKEGVIDCIATDHAPHTEFDKNVSLANSANGIVGLETAIGVVFTHLITPGLLTLEEAIGALTYKPAQIFGLNNKGRLTQGYDADITIIDPQLCWTVDSKEFCSKGKNTPFNGWKLKGKSVTTIVNGKTVWSDENIPVKGVK